MPKRKPRVNRPEQERAEAEAFLTESFGFLVSEFGYAPSPPIVLRTADVEVRGYVNPKAGRQVEVSGSPIGYTIAGGIRRFVSGQPAPYDQRDHWISFHEIAEARHPQVVDRLSHNLNPDYWRGAVAETAQLLRNNSDLLTGKGWIDHKPSDYSPLDEFRAAFAFLLERGFVVTFDTDTLSPHEYLVLDTLRFEKGGHRVEIGAREYYGDWAVEYDGKLVGALDRSSVKEVARQLERLI
jgi:hypothetical protein